MAAVIGTAFAAGVVSELAAAQLPASAVAWWMRRPRPELGGVAPTAAMVAGAGAAVLALARADAAWIACNETSYAPTGGVEAEQAAVEASSEDPAAGAVTPDEAGQRAGTVSAASARIDLPLRWEGDDA